jgi:hypothetical protein
MVRTGRPATGVTPLRNVRVADELWDAAKERAAENGETLTEVIVRALRRYVAATRRPAK